MKVKVVILHEVEIEVDDCVQELDNFWRTHTHQEWANVPDALLNSTTRAVEYATGLRFGIEDDAKKPCGTISSVCAMDGEAILEW